MKNIHYYLFSLNWFFLISCFFTDAALAADNRDALFASIESEHGFTFLEALHSTNGEVVDKQAGDLLKLMLQRYNSKHHTMQAELEILATHPAIVSLQLHLDSLRSIKNKHNKKALRNVQHALAFAPKPSNTMPTTIVPDEHAKDYQALTEMIERNKIEEVTRAMETSKVNLAQFSDAQGLNLLDVALNHRHLSVAKLLTVQKLWPNKSTDPRSLRLLNLAMLEGELYEQALLTTVIENFREGLKRETESTFLRGESSHVTGLTNYFQHSHAFATMRDRLLKIIHRVKGVCNENDLNDGRQSEKCEHVMVTLLADLRDICLGHDDRLSPQTRFFWSIEHSLRSQFPSKSTENTTAKFLNLIFLRFINPTLVQGIDNDAGRITAIKILQALVNDIVGRAKSLESREALTSRIEGIVKLQAGTSDPTLLQKLSPEFRMKANARMQEIHEACLSTEE